MRNIQKNIRVSKEVAEWMDKHPLSDNSLVNYGLYLLMQMEKNLLKPDVKISSVTITEPYDKSLPEWAR